MAKFALHTATNYTGTANELRGCINDWKNFNKLDDYLEIPDRNVISLIGSGYTKQLATEAVSKMAAIMEPGDLLIGSNSSHGTQVTDYNGDEIDGKDEALVDNNCELILDDDIFAGLKKFQEGTLIVAWLDNCFAGTMDRAFFAKNWHLMDTDVKCNAVMYFGCREDQTSADAYIDGKFQGALTYCSLKALRDANYNITYRELLDRTNELLRNGGYTQRAQMAVSSESLLDKKVFTA